MKTAFTNTLTLMDGLHHLNLQRRRQRRNGDGDLDIIGEVMPWFEALSLTRVA